MITDTIPEHALADELGLHHKLLRELRKKNAADSSEPIPRLCRICFSVPLKHVITFQSHIYA
jgi:hypothetical protein